MRSGGRGASNDIAPNTLFYKGYYSADFCFQHRVSNANDRGKKVIKGYVKTVFP